MRNVQGDREEERGGGGEREREEAAFESRYFRNTNAAVIR
jgi:hypothetical protein